MPDETTDHQAAASAGANAEEPAGAQGEEPKDALPEIGVAVEDAGVLKKKVTVTIPRARIDAKFDEMFGELSHTAQIPGFRIGRAPRKLIEKRFGKEISQDVRNAVIGQSLSAAIDKAQLKTIGEPDIDLDKLQLPDAGDMSYDFQIEVLPEFELPSIKGIPVTKTVHPVTDERIDQYIESLVESRATYEPTGAAAEEGDMVLAGAVIRGEGVEPVERHGLQLRVAPGQVEGLPLVDLGDKLSGKKAGDTAEVPITVPQAHPNEAWRGKALTVALMVSEVRRRRLPTIDEEFAKQSGFDSLKDFREYVGGQLRSRLTSETQREMRDQIGQFLLDHANFDLPEGLVAHRTAGIVQRRYVDLLYQGVPRERIEEHLTELQAAAGEEAKRMLKLSLITQKIAELEKIEVTHDETNARIAQMAAMSRRRPERLKQELAQDGSLARVEESLLDEKVLDKLLGDGQITEVEAPKPPPKVRKAAKAAEKPAEKKPAAKAKGEPKAQKESPARTEKPKKAPGAKAHKAEKKPAAKGEATRKAGKKPPKKSSK